MIAGYALIGSAAALLAASVWTARRPPGTVDDLNVHLDRWALRHHGYDPRGNAWVHGLLRIAFPLARRLARRGVRPDLLSLWGVWLAAAAVLAAQAGGRWALLAGALLALSGFSDAIDGAVAAMTGRATRWGFVLDSLADRVSDLAYLLALWLAGAPAGLAVAAGVAFGLLEYLRARAGAAGMDEIGVVTVAERPVRIICCTAGLLGAGMFVAHAALITGAAMGLLSLLSVVGLVQLAVAVHRALSRPPAAP